MYRTLSCLLLWCVTGSLCAGSAGVPAGAAGINNATSAYPLWDGRETVAQYAGRVGLDPALTLHLGGGVSMELLLVPAGIFTMGTPAPEPVDEAGFARSILTAQAVLAGSLVVFLGFVFVIVGQALRLKRRIQYSLAQFFCMMLVLAVVLWGGMQWWQTMQRRAEARRACAILAADEVPAHEVLISRPFYLGKHEVTQSQFTHVMGGNPSKFQGANVPVERACWDDAQAFCRKVSAQAPAPVGKGATPTERVPGEGTGATVAPSSGVEAPPSPYEGATWAVRLPTEAEWEYACRAGTRTASHAGSTEKDLDRVAWYEANSAKTTHPVGMKEPNAWGLHDMNGNVWEACQDWFSPDYYAHSPRVDPQGPQIGSMHTLRGGAWDQSARGSYCAMRSRHDPTCKGPDRGFRVAVSLPQK